MREMLGERKRITSQFLLKKVQDARQTEIPLTITQHSPGAPLETIYRTRRQRTPQRCQNFAACNRATKTNNLAFVDLGFG
jgi:hypothetical protein